MDRLQRQRPPEDVAPRYGCSAEEHEAIRVPDTPDDAVGRYVTLLLQWEDLTRRQTAYEAALATLEATGDQLRPEWNALTAQLRACREALHGLALPAEAVIERVWMLLKRHLWLLCQPGDKPGATRPQYP